MREILGSVAWLITALMGNIGGITITLGFLENIWWRLFENGYLEMLLYWATLSFSQAWHEEKPLLCCCAALNCRNLCHRHEFTFPFVGLRALEKCSAENTDIFSPVTTQSLELLPTQKEIPLDRYKKSQYSTLFVQTTNGWNLHELLPLKSCHSHWL